MKIGERDFLGNLHPIEGRAADFGIRIREAGNTEAMEFYLELLREEVRMTEAFLASDARGRAENEKRRQE